MGTPFYPNLYTILVGPPGVGKTNILNKVEALWTGLKSHHLAPTSVTKSSFVDHLNEATRIVITPSHKEKPAVSFNALNVISREMSVLIPEYENGFIAALTDAYDGKRYEESIRTGNRRTKIDAPCINLVCGTTPSYLGFIMPEGAWDQGFIARNFLIYSGEIARVDIFAEIPDDEGTSAALAKRFGAIATLFGEMKFTDDTKNAIRNWDASDGPPAPTHPRLQHYLTRRTSHLVKLCIIASVSRSLELVIRLEDYQTALGWLLESEAYIPDIFKAMGSGGDSRVMDEAWHMAYQFFVKNKRAVPAQLLVQFISQRVPGHSVMRILEVMVQSHMLRHDLTAGVVSYLPQPRQ